MANRTGVRVQSVVRALEILKLFENNSELSLSQISDRMDLSKSTVYGLVNTLVIQDFLEQLKDTKKYKLGIKNFELGNCFSERMDLREEARPYLETLINKYHETIHLAKHYHGEVVYIDKFEGSNFNIISSQVGRRAPMHCTGVGKVQLAYLPKEYLEKYIFSKDLKKYTEKSIISKESLLKELEQIRKQGYSFDDEEIEIGLICVAIPILGLGGEPLAGISISAPTGRMSDERKMEMAEDLVKISNILSKRMGY